MMLRRYGAEPIRLDNNDIRRREMMTVGSSNKHIQRKQYSLNTSVTLVVNRHEYDHLKHRGPEVGFHWYEADKRRMFLFIWGRVTGGLPATHAIYDYYAMHEIEEDDFPIETSERLWKRWRVEKEKEVIPNTPQTVLLPVSLLLGVKQGKILAERIVEMIRETGIDFDRRYYRIISRWVLCDLTNMTHHEVAQLENRNDKNNITRSVVAFRNYLNYNQDLRKIVAYCVATTRARPTPST